MENGGRGIALSSIELYLTGGVPVPGTDYDPNDPSNPNLGFAVNGEIVIDDSVGEAQVGAYDWLSGDVNGSPMFQTLGQAGDLAGTELNSAVANMAVVDAAFVGGWYAPEIMGATSHVMRAAGECGEALYYNPDFISNASEILDTLAGDPQFSPATTISGDIAFVLALFGLLGP